MKELRLEIEELDERIAPLIITGDGVVSGFIDTTKTGGLFLFLPLPTADPGGIVPCVDIQFGPF